MRGLDPRIHPSSQESFEEDGLPGQARQWRAFCPMRTDLFDFELPAENIALRPASPRDSARMLVVQPGGALRDQTVAELPHLLRPGDQLVVNDTKVIAAQLSGRRIGRDTEPKIEATLIKRVDGS